MSTTQRQSWKTSETYERKLQTDKNRRIEQLYMQAEKGAPDPTTDGQRHVISNNRNNSIQSLASQGKPETTPPIPAKKEAQCHVSRQAQLTQTNQTTTWLKVHTNTDHSHVLDTRSLPVFYDYTGMAPISRVLRVFLCSNPSSNRAIYRLFCKLKNNSRKLKGSFQHKLY